ncbi:MAG TPA: T9SS type A sorting domain-containing protein [bacterium]|nr:T9SS type A sorting domain-containing protein [bacterium]
MNRLLWYATLFATLCIIPSVVIGVTDDANNLIVGAGETYTLGGVHSYSVSVQVASTGVLYVTSYDGTANTGYLELHAPTVTVGGTINGDGRGYRTAEGPGAGTYPGGGGAYGGNGGASGWGNAGGTAYGTVSGSDIAMGSGGANQTLGVGGAGGARISLYATALTVSGAITVKGNQGSDVTGWGDGGGGGAGGGIYLNATTISGSGALAANGGRGGNSVQRRGGGGGGGGRIKLFYCWLNFTGTQTETGGAGGVGGWPANGAAGSNGTYYTAVRVSPAITAIVDVANDQGRQVRITWIRSCLDDPEESYPVVKYDIWRKIDGTLMAADRDQGKVLDPQSRLSYPPGSWDFVMEVPARGEAAYNVVAPTLADSNSTGMHRSTFFVSGVTANPFVYYDSDPDSGYSVDNLPPGPPSGFTDTYAGGANHLVWDANLETDFRYYSLHRGTTADFVPDASNLLAEQAATGYVDAAASTYYYKLAAVDINGNVSTYSLASPASSGTPAANPVAMSLRVASPAISRVTVQFALLSDQPAKLGVYDVTGRLVESRDASSRGQHSVDLELSAGIYFIRLTQGAEAKTARVVVVH